MLLVAFKPLKTMSVDKSKNLAFFANELKNADREITTIKRLDELPMASLNIYNGSGEKCDLQICDGLKKPLMEFLLNHFKEEKQKIYGKMAKELETV
jgi:hypothetical protein